MMTAHFSQMRILGKVDGPFLHTCWWLQRLILDALTLLHFGQMKVWVVDDWDAARSSCLLQFSLVASCLSDANLQLDFLTDEHQLSQPEASCRYD